LIQQYGDEASEKNPELDIGACPGSAREMKRKTSELES
jgi:hypothetical protein